MINRFGLEIKRGDLVSYHSARGDVRTGFVRKFFWLSGYGRYMETTAGSCGIDDVIKVTRQFLRPGFRVEVPYSRNGRPGYRWVQGWQVLNPETGHWSVDVRRSDALAMVSAMRAGNAT